MRMSSSLRARVSPFLFVQVAPVSQQIIDRSSNPFDFFRRLVLVPRVLNRGKAQTRPAERIASVEPLLSVLGTCHKPPFVEKLRGERANIWVQAAGFGQENALVGGDGRTPIQQVTESRDLCAGRMNALLRLVELLRIAKQHNAGRGWGQPAHSRETSDPPRPRRARPRN